MWPNHRIGQSRIEYTVSITKLMTNSPAPPNPRRSSGRNKISMALAIFGANHITSMDTNSAVPASARMKLAGVSENATSSVPSTSSPTQAGEPMNITIASAN